MLPIVLTSFCLKIDQESVLAFRAARALVTDLPDALKVGGFLSYDNSRARVRLKWSSFHELCWSVDINHYCSAWKSSLNTFGQ